MAGNTKYDVIIIGGSYSGLAAAMALGRALRNVLVIDNGKPCNMQTPHAHNFITHDGSRPAEIAQQARAQVEQYDTVHFYKGLAAEGTKTNDGFEITTEDGKRFHARRLIFASGIRDIMPDIKGFAECWGISVLHCPYCHGYEVRNEKTAVFANGDMAYEIAKMIQHWAKDLVLFTNGLSTLTDEQRAKLQSHNIRIVETEIDSIAHNNGYIQNVVLKDGSSAEVKAMYAHPEFVQHCIIPEKLGCEKTDHGYLVVDNFMKTTVDGIYACGDSTSFMRSLANAVATGTMTGATCNRGLIEEEF